MHDKAFAPEYQGALANLSINTPLADVLVQGVEQLRAARSHSSRREMARCGLAVAEAHRRLGNIPEADQAWKASYRDARADDDFGAMAWALWSGGNLARQRGALPLAFRLHGYAAESGKRGGDAIARGYSLAGMAETGRIQGHYETVETLHEELLAEARRRAEARHTVWALEGLAQIRRNTGKWDSARTLFEEAVTVAADADDWRGHAWALRGVADIVSAREGDTARALDLLTEAEETCRTMRLFSALAYNHKMRGNVLYRAGRYSEARAVYEQALEEFRGMGERRGEALARLGLVKSLARLGQEHRQTVADLDELRNTMDSIGIRHARTMVDQAHEELGLTLAATGSP